MQRRKIERVRLLIGALVVIMILIAIPKVGASPMEPVTVYVHVREIMSDTDLPGTLIDTTLYVPSVGGGIVSTSPTDQGGYVRLIGQAYPGESVGVFVSRGALGGRFYTKIPLSFCGYREMSEFDCWHVWVRVVYPSASTRVRWEPIHDQG